MNLYSPVFGSRFFRHLDAHSTFPLHKKIFAKHNLCAFVQGKTKMYFFNSGFEVDCSLDQAFLLKTSCISTKKIVHIACLPSLNIFIIARSNKICH